MTYEALAKQMGDVGCAIQPSAIHRIEKGDPPRSVKVDELIAFTKVFGLDSVDDMLVPYELVQEREVRALLDEVLATGRDLAEVFERAVSAWTQLMQFVVADHPDTEFRDFVNSHLNASEWSPHLIGERIAGQINGSDYALDTFRDLVKTMFSNFGYATQRLAGHRVAPDRDQQYLVTYTDMEK